MYRAFVCACLGLVMLAAVSANSTEVAFSLENRIGGDQNILRTSTDTKSDGFWEIVPKVTIRERNRELRYDFQYTPIYETFFETDGIDGWDHIQSGRFDWDITPRDTLGFTQEFAETRRIRQESAEAFESSSPIVQETDRQRIRRAGVGLYYVHFFTPRWSARVDANFSDIDFNSPFDVDTRAYGGSLSGQYIWSEQLTLGVYGSGRYRQSLGVGRQPSSNSGIGNIAASVSADLAILGNSLQGWELFVQAGPSIVRTEADDITGATVPEYTFATDGQSLLARAIDVVGPGPEEPLDACNFQGQDLLLACPFLAFDPNFPPDFSNPSGLVSLGPPLGSDGKSDTDISYFAEVNLTKSWELTKLYLTYSRSESASSGVATSSILDVLSARVTYAPSPAWWFSFIASWTQREYVQAVEQSVVAVKPNGLLRQDPNVQPPVPGTFYFAQADSLTTVVTTNSSSSEETSWSTAFSVKRQLSRQITLVSYFRYAETDNQTEISSSTIESVFGYVGLRYEFDTVIF
jgi:hypothetical protein